jgi:hypothetical protein
MIEAEQLLDLIAAIYDTTVDPSVWMLGGNEVAHDRVEHGQSHRDIEAAFPGESFKQGRPETPHHAQVRAVCDRHRRTVLEVA